MKRKEKFEFPPGWMVRAPKPGLIAMVAMILGLAVLAGAKDPAKTNAATGDNAAKPATAAAAKSRVTYSLYWYSFNSGGASYGTSATRNLGYTIGQTVAGQGSSGANNLGIGFWHGSCLAEKGDMNADGVYTSPDVVLLSNCTFLGTGLCDPCFADVNCDGSLTSPDVVLISNRTFLGLTAPPWCGP